MGLGDKGGAKGWGDRTGLGEKGGQRGWGDRTGLGDMEWTWGEVVDDRTGVGDMGDMEDR